MGNFKQLDLFITYLENLDNVKEVEKINDNQFAVYTDNGDAEIFNFIKGKFYYLKKEVNMDNIKSFILSKKKKTLKEYNLNRNSINDKIEKYISKVEQQNKKYFSLKTNFFNNSSVHTFYNENDKIIILVNNKDYDKFIVIRYDNNEIYFTANQVILGFKKLNEILKKKSL